MNPLTTKIVDAIWEICPWDKEVKSILLIPSNKLASTIDKVVEDEGKKDDRVYFADYIQRCVIDRGPMTYASIVDAIDVWDKTTQNFTPPNNPT